MSLVSTWIGDGLGIPGAVSILCLFGAKLPFFLCIAYIYHDEQSSFCQNFEAHYRVENFTAIRMQKSASRFVDGEASYERSKFVHSSASKAVPLSLLLCACSSIISAIYATKMQI